MRGTGACWKRFSPMCLEMPRPIPEKGLVITVSLKNGVFCVENTDARIEEEDLKNIFMPFYRVEQSRSRNSGGSGLGLYITKTILDITGFHIKWKYRKGRAVCGGFLRRQKPAWQDQTGSRTLRFGSRYFYV